IPAQLTSRIQYNANLPAQPQTPATQSGVTGSNLLDPANFTANPLAGAPQPATISGANANLQPDTPATGTGTVGGLANGTLLTTLGVSNGDVITLTDGTNPLQYTVTNASTVGNLLTALSGANFNTTLQGGKLQVQSVNDID